MFNKIIFSHLTIFFAAFISSYSYANPYFDDVRKIARSNGNSILSISELWMGFGKAIVAKTVDCDSSVSMFVRKPRFSLELFSKVGLEKLTDILLEETEHSSTVRLVFEDSSSLNVRFLIPSEARKKQVKDALIETTTDGTTLRRVDGVKSFFSKFGRFYVQSYGEYDLIVYDLDDTEERVILAGCTIQRTCEACSATLLKPKRCGACKRSYYCDDACQKLDWKKKHRGFCGGTKEKPMSCSIGGTWRLVRAKRGDQELNAKVLAGPEQVISYQLFDNKNRAIVRWTHPINNPVIKGVYSDMVLEVDAFIRETNDDGWFRSRPISGFESSVQMLHQFDDETQLEFEKTVRPFLDSLESRIELYTSVMPLMSAFEGTPHLDGNRLILVGKSEGLPVTFILEKIIEN